LVFVGECGPVGGDGIALDIADESCSDGFRPLDRERLGIGTVGWWVGGTSRTRSRDALDASGNGFDGFDGFDGFGLFWLLRLLLLLMRFLQRTRGTVVTVLMTIRTDHFGNLLLVMLAWRGLEGFGGLGAIEFVGREPVTQILFVCCGVSRSSRVSRIL
jgi:hypothetical protein